MRSIQWAVAVVLTGGLLGCGGSQPSVYRVALEQLTLENIPAACYSDGQVPTPIPDRATNIFDQEQWVIWEGLDDAVYLEPGTINYGLADAERVVIPAEAIAGSEGDDGHVFTSQRVRTESANQVYTTSASYKIEELGKTLRGSLTLSSSCTGSECTGVPTCSVSLDFTGVQIDADRFIGYDSGSNE